MKTNRIIAVVAFVLYAWALNAQIGYQVSLLNTATGEPRANETVSVTVEIINSQNTVICSETKSATTDDFGVLSLQVGTASTFKDVDWTKLPLYVSATVDGITIGKSQILNVPVAETAKSIVGLSPDLICKTWTMSCYCNGSETDGGTIRLTLQRDKTFTFSICGETYGYGTYYMLGNLVLLGNVNTNYEATQVPYIVVYNEGAMTYHMEKGGVFQLQ